MPAGRPPKSLAAKLLAGNPGKRPLPAPHQNKSATMLKPRAVADCPRQSYYWDFYQKYDELGLLATVDSTSLATLCQLSAFRDELAEAIGRRAVPDDPPDTSLVRQYVQLADSLRKQLTSMGMDVLARQKNLGAKSDEPENPADKFFQ